MYMSVIRASRAECSVVPRWRLELFGVGARGPHESPPHNPQPNPQPNSTFTPLYRAANLSCLHRAVMGLKISSLMDRLGFGRKDPRKLLVLGLDNAGKTTYLYQLKLGEVLSTTPTIGFNLESVQYRSVKFNAWDIGGQKKIRQLWRYYYQGTDGLIFVVDSADTSRDRMEDVKEELHSMLGSPELAKAKVLIMANKQDDPRAMPPAKLADQLGLNSLKSHEWFIQGCCATTGDGIHAGLDWLVDALNRRK